MISVNTGYVVDTGHKVDLSKYFSPKHRQIKKLPSFSTSIMIRET